MNIIYKQMINAQAPMLNECSYGECINVLNNLFIENSLKIVNCKLNIKPTLGGV